jgi:hypothetical protein
MDGGNNSPQPFPLSAYYCISLPSPQVSKCFPLAKIIATNIPVKGMAYRSTYWKRKHFSWGRCGGSILMKLLSVVSAWACGALKQLEINCIYDKCSSIKPHAIIITEKNHGKTACTHTEH